VACSTDRGSDFSGKEYGDPWMSLFVCCFVGGFSSLFLVLAKQMFCDCECQLETDSLLKPYGGRVAVQYGSCQMALTACRTF
jgi:hypothetical protein